MPKYDREPVAWITRGGKHIPIFDKEEDKKSIGEIKIVEEWGDSSGQGQYDQTLVAKNKSGKIVGRVTVSYYDDEAYIKWVEVPEKYRRMGVATKMYKYIESQNKGKPVKRFGGVSTPEGLAFRKFYEKK